MYDELLAVFAAGAFTLWYGVHFHQNVNDTSLAMPKINRRLQDLWRRTEQSIRNQRWRSAEKTLLSILKIDHKNVVAYNRLGVIYAKQGNYADSLECFEIASSLTPTLSTLYNLGLVQYEQKMYKEAAATFERVIELEPTPQRYIAYAKSQLKLENHKKVAQSLEKAATELKSVQLYELLSQAYERVGDRTAAHGAMQEADKLRAKQQVHKRLSERNRRAKATKTRQQRRLGGRIA